MGEAKTVWVHLGRDILRDDGWFATILIAARPDLMRRDEEGLEVISGLNVCVYFRNPSPRWRRRWRSPVVVSVHSDREQIGRRNAINAGMTEIAA